MNYIAGNPYLINENGVLLIDSVPVDVFFKENTTPFFIFIEKRIRDNVNTFREIFSSIFQEFECFYSFKANYLPEICKIIQSENIGAEIIGELEFNLALKLGFPPKKIILGGPYLPVGLISKSIQHEVKEIIVYNLNDLERINALSKQQDHVQNVCIRINSQKYNSKLGIVLNQKNHDFLLRAAKTFHNIRITSMLSHLTTQMNDVNQYKQNLEAIATHLQQLRKDGIEIKNLNLGGGFPEATVMKKNQLQKIAITLKNTMKELEIDVEKIYFEPGRYFVGDAGIIISEIVNVNDDRMVFINAGNHICPKFAKAAFRFYNISHLGAAHKYETQINGIIPTDQDVLAKNYFFSKEIQEGDKILITNAGAYTLTFSNRFPYPLPCILIINGTKINKIFDPNKQWDFSLSPQ